MAEVSNPARRKGQMDFIFCLLNIVTDITQIDLELVSEGELTNG